MKIRTVTYFTSANPTPDSLGQIASKLKSIADDITAPGFEVQTIRIALPHWRDSSLSKLTESECVARVEQLVAFCEQHDVTVLALGLAREVRHIERFGALLPLSPLLCGAADCGSALEGIDDSAVAASAELIKGQQSVRGGLGNFQFAAGFCIEPHVPFCPVACGDSSGDSFSIGFENSDVLASAFAESGPSIGPAIDRFRSDYTRHCQRVEQVARLSGQRLGVTYQGIDTSIAPSLAPDESIVRAFAAVDVPFGAPGTLAVCSHITSVLQSIDVKRIGYCGLMLSVMEDHGLSSDAGAVKLRAGELLTYSAVCGTGIDMVPMPGETSAADLRNLLRDVGALAVRLKKPLAARCVPMPGKTHGDRTDVDSPYLCNTNVRRL